ncbi:MAG: hypothetical protein FWD25_11830 [Clostridia bacterium]|nr:hypothetical protein [Clostridia bacterium]
MQHITANTARKDFDGLLDTVYLQSIPGMVESIKEAREAPASERLEDIGWGADI